MRRRRRDEVEREEKGPSVRREEEGQGPERAPRDGEEEGTHPLALIVPKPRPNKPLIG